MSYTRTSHKEGFFSTGRMVGWGVFLIVAGIAAPEFVLARVGRRRMSDGITAALSLTDDKRFAAIRA